MEFLLVGKTAPFTLSRVSIRRAPEKEPAPVISRALFEAKEAIPLAKRRDCRFASRVHLSSRRKWLGHFIDSLGINLVS
jgi:hypothetical protein